MSEKHYTEVSFIDKHTEKRILDNLKKKSNLIQKKYRLIIFLMLDCGLRVTEVCRLETQHINFQDGKNGSVKVKSLKKRKRKKDKEFRVIPMTYRCLESASEYWMTLKGKRRKEGAYLFLPNRANERGDHLSRNAIWKMLKKLSSDQVYPHKLRHTYGTELIANGADIVTAKNLMGHESTRTTEIYIHAKREKIQEAVDAIEIVPWYEKVRRKFFPIKRNMLVIPTSTGLTNFHVGRKKELDSLQGSKLNFIIF